MKAAGIRHHDGMRFISGYMLNMKLNPKEKKNPILLMYQAVYRRVRREFGLREGCKLNFPHFWVTHETSTRIQDLLYRYLMRTHRMGSLEATRESMAIMLQMTPKVFEVAPEWARDNVIYITDKAIEEKSK